MEQLVLDALKKQVEEGRSKTSLEKEIGLPKNSLSNVLKGRTHLSKASFEKCERYFNLKQETNEEEGN